MSATRVEDLASLSAPKTYANDLYRIWYGMKRRCFSPSEPSYFRYGGRGITVCERWLTFENFVADMGPRPSKAHSIDRYPNNDGNYEPGNCRWATHAEQRANQAYTQYVLHEGRAVKMSEYRVLVGISTLAIFAGFKDGSIPECCRRGHLFTADNTTIYDGKRWCATCRRASERRSWERRRPAEYDAMSPIQRETLEAAAKRVNGAVIVPDKVLHGVCRTNVISALKRKGWITPVEPFLITPAARALLTDDQQVQR